MCIKERNEERWEVGGGGATATCFQRQVADTTRRRGTARLPIGSSHYLDSCRGFPRLRQRKTKGHDCAISLILSRTKIEVARALCCGRTSDVFVYAAAWGQKKVQGDVRSGGSHRRALSLHQVLGVALVCCVRDDVGNLDMPRASGSICHLVRDVFGNHGNNPLIDFRGFGVVTAKADLREFSLHHSWANGCHPNGCACQIVAGSDSKGLHCMLGRTVDRPSGVAFVGSDRRDVDDVTATPLLHAWGEDGNQSHGGGDVRRHHLLDVLNVVLVGWGHSESQTCVVDQDVDLAH
mmetsp:Transcript_9372/g.13875  ORF Transcript_9372/g.13875 Transcript_9372/m.13875 type:complete len:293 (+) Transcript_9372:89-967(+)